MLLETYIIPDTTNMEDYMAKTKEKTVHEKIFDAAVARPQDILSFREFEKAVPETSIQNIRYHVQRMVDQGALTRIKLNQYQLNHSYKTAAVKGEEVRRSVMSGESRLTVTTNGSMFNGHPAPEVPYTAQAVVATLPTTEPALALPMRNVTPDRTITPFNETDKMLLDLITSRMNKSADFNETDMMFMLRIEELARR